MNDKEDWQRGDDDCEAADKSIHFMSANRKSASIAQLSAEL